MYNGIGLTTARGSGTNGYVQASLAYIKPSSGRRSFKKVDDEKWQKNSFESTVKKPNLDLIKHENRRKIELKCLEVRELMESEKLNANVIEEKVAEYRDALIADMEEQHSQLKVDYDQYAARLSKRHNIHEEAIAQDAKNTKFREALRIDKDYQEGSGFQPKEKPEPNAERESSPEVHSHKKKKRKSKKKESKKKKHKKSHKHKKRKRSSSSSRSPSIEHRKDLDAPSADELSPSNFGVFTTAKNSHHHDNNRMQSSVSPTHEGGFGVIQKSFIEAVPVTEKSKSRSRPKQRNQWRDNNRNTSRSTSPNAHQARNRSLSPVGFGVITTTNLPKTVDSRNSSKKGGRPKTHRHLPSKSPERADTKAVVNCASSTSGTLGFVGGGKRHDTSNLSRKPKSRSRSPRADKHKISKDKISTSYGVIKRSKRKSRSRSPSPKHHRRTSRDDKSAQRQTQEDVESEAEQDMPELIWSDEEVDTYVGTLEKQTKDDKKHGNTEASVSKDRSNQNSQSLKRRSCSPVHRKVVVKSKIVVSKR